MSAQWIRPLLLPVLGPGEVHVWCADLDLVAGLETDLVAILAPDERARAARLHFARDRARYITGRAVLRSILAHYLAVTPDRLHLAYSAHGKPYLPYTAGGHFPRLEFNMAHSDDMALYAVSVGRPVGVDVERIRPILETGLIVNNFFSPAEAVDFRRLPLEQQMPAFFRAWTRKEAWLKASGEGLAHPADRVEVSLAPEAGAKLSRIDGDAVEASQWSIIDLQPRTGYAGALAFRALDCTVRFWQYDFQLGAGPSWLGPGTLQYGRLRLS